MKQLDCPFCGPYDYNDTQKLFSLGFQSLGICLGCVTMAIDGHATWRWEQGECIRCMTPGIQIFRAAPNALAGYGDNVGVCLKCLNAGKKYLTGAEPVPVATPQKTTREEQITGNL